MPTTTLLNEVAAKHLNKPAAMDETATEAKK